MQKERDKLYKNWLESKNEIAMTQEEIIKGFKEAIPDGTYSEKEMQLAAYMFTKGCQFAAKANVPTWDSLKDYMGC